MDARGLVRWITCTALAGGFGPLACAHPSVQADRGAETDEQVVQRVLKLAQTSQIAVGSDGLMTRTASTVPIAPPPMTAMVCEVGMELLE
jgi:hypothetical protein